MTNPIALAEAMSAPSTTRDLVQMFDHRIDVPEQAVYQQFSDAGTLDLAIQVGEARATLGNSCLEDWDYRIKANVLIERLVQTYGILKPRFTQRVYP